MATNTLVITVKYEDDVDEDDAQAIADGLACYEGVRKVEVALSGKPPAAIRTRNLRGEVQRIL